MATASPLPHEFGALPMIAASFIGFLLIFDMIGAASRLQRRANTPDYLLAGRGCNTWPAAIAAGATNNDSSMF